MNSKTLVVLGAALMLVLGITLQVSGEPSEGDMCVPMGMITLKPPPGVQAQKAEVQFPHARHFATECRVCHHKWEGQEKIQGCMSTGCHDLASAPKKTEAYLSYSDVSIRYFKYAYHQACIGCHKSIRASNLERAKSYQVSDETLPTAGPSGCVECHQE
jgi:hypothetical protein